MSKIGEPPKRQQPAPQSIRERRLQVRATGVGVGVGVGAGVGASVGTGVVGVPGDEPPPEQATTGMSSVMSPARSINVILHREGTP